MLTVEQIQQHFIEGLSNAIRRPGMHGGELGLDYMLDRVVYVTETGDRRTWRGALEAAGAWSSIGVTGMVQTVLPGDRTGAVASVYADYAHQHGWLSLDRTLSEAEYGDLRGQLTEYCASDRSWTDVLAQLGEPSVQIGGVVKEAIGYGRPGEAIVWFHVASDQAVLAARCGVPLVESMRFTPEGARRKPAD
ncbi:hypothetical protein ACWGID_02405 [Kribbella sp. NPDC054772]